MCCRRLVEGFFAVVFILSGAGCANHPASDAVKAFTIALADSSWSEAWDMLTPETQAAWDSTAAVMQRFGYTESSFYLLTLNNPVTEEEFPVMDGAMLFARMVETAPETAVLSSSVREVEEIDSLSVLVTLATVDGPQTIPVRQVGDRWLLDLTTLTPPPEIPAD